jgi:hypothetical protein
VVVVVWVFWLLLNKLFVVVGVVFWVVGTVGMGGLMGRGLTILF